MDFDTVKALGILGAALMIASVVLTPVSWLVGAVLVLLSLYYLGQAYGVRSIFDYALYGLIFAFVPAFLVPLMIVGFFGFMPMFMPMHMPGNWPFAPFAGFWILVFLVVFVMLVLSGFFFYRSMDVLASRSGVELFRVAGMLTLIGAATLILFLLGFILILASWVILAVAFYSLKKPPSGVQV
ncbi:MAG: DUF996 domain-containing protein [Thermoprotei archaeon]|nr:DUF996 domain-containing protein [Thermoprotei archaeon]